MHNIDMSGRFNFWIKFKITQEHPHCAIHVLGTQTESSDPLAKVPLDIQLRARWRSAPAPPIYHALSPDFPTAHAPPTPPAYSPPNSAAHSPPNSPAFSHNSYAPYPHNSPAPTTTPPIPPDTYSPEY